MELRERLNGIFREVFDDDGIQIAPEMTSNDIEGWDSLSHVNLIVAVESHFKIRFTQRELLAQKNIGDLMNAIAAKTAS